MTHDNAINKGASSTQANSQLSTTNSNTIIAAIQKITPDVEAALTACFQSPWNTSSFLL